MAVRGDGAVTDDCNDVFRNRENAKADEDPRNVGSEPAVLRLSVPMMDDRSSSSSG
jgi:hypothetical protein